MSVSYSGAGTDIFIRKVRPGAAVGVGYFFDVYENGIKIESTKIDTKKHVLKLIKDYKEKYHTNRAFENELQVHITYKTKEERGEIAMQSLDQELLKKANNINIALQKLISPGLPIKIREAELAVGNNIDFIPTTPGGTEGMMDENGIGATIATKFVEFVSSNQPQQGQEWVKADNLYNPLKKWLTAISKKIKEFEQSNNSKLDRNKISDIAEQILLSGDPGLLQSKTQLQVSPEVASKIKEIATMKAGIRKPTTTQEQGISAPTPQEAPPRAANINEELKKIADELDNLDKDEGFGDDSAELNFDKLVKTDESEEDALLLPPTKNNDIESLKKSFFDYAKGINKIATLDDIFTDWNNKEDIDYIISKQVFSAINDEISTNFNKNQTTPFEEATDFLLGEVSEQIAQKLSKSDKVSLDQSFLNEIADSIASDSVIQLAVSNFLYKYFLKDLENKFVEMGDINESSVDSITLDNAMQSIKNNKFIKSLTDNINNNLKRILGNQFLNKTKNVSLYTIFNLSKSIADQLIMIMDRLFPKYKESFKTHPNGLPKLLEQYKRHWNEDENKQIESNSDDVV
ncbi:MAG: hypothetical protein WC554_10075 [Clostridia bacterium]